MTPWPHCWFRSVAAGAATALLACASTHPASAASYTHRGHYGFVTLSADEVGDATRFEAAIVPPGGAFIPASRARCVVALPTPDGATLYVGGWPSGLSGRSDLILHALSPDGTCRTLAIPQAVTVTSRRMDVAILLDDSYSMRETDPLRLRVAAVRLFARIAAARGDIRTLTLVSFSRRAHLLLPPTSPADTNAIEHALAKLASAGSTDLDAAFAMACEQLDPLPESRKDVVVLSDGRDEPGDYENAHLACTARHWPVHTVGLSALADLPTLRRIAADTGGTFHEAPDNARLEAIFQDIALTLHASVEIGSWPVANPADDRLPPVVPVDDSVRQLTFTLTAAAATATCAVRAPDGSLHALTADGRRDGLDETLHPAAGPWPVTAMTGNARLDARASSDLEIIPFPPSAVLTSALPAQAACLVLRNFEPCADVDVSATVGDSAPAPLKGERLHAGWVTPAAAGRVACRFVARGRTPAGYAFQRTAAQEWQVSEAHVNTIWVQPEAVRIAVFPGSSATGSVAIAGHGDYRAAIAMPDTASLGARIETDTGTLPALGTTTLPITVTATPWAQPCSAGGEVALEVSGASTQGVPLILTCQTPELTVGPARLDFGALAPGSAATGEVWAVLASPGAVAMKIKAGPATLSATVSPTRTCLVDASRTSRWQVVVQAPSDTSTVTSHVGAVVLEWTWGRHELPWQLTIPAPPPSPATNAAAEVLPPSIPPPEPPAATPAALAETPAAAAESESDSVQPAGGFRDWVASVNWWHVLVALALLAALVATLARWLRRSATHPHRMLMSFLISVLVHALAILIALDLAVQMRAVDLHELAPDLVVDLEALQQVTGLSVLPPGPAIATRERESVADVARAAPSSEPETRAAFAAAAESQADPVAIPPPQPAAPEPQPALDAAVQAKTRLAEPATLETAATQIQPKLATTAAAPQEARPLEATAPRVAGAEARPAANGRAAVIENAPPASAPATDEPLPLTQPQPDGTQAQATEKRALEVAAVEETHDAPAPHRAARIQDVSRAAPMPLPRNGRTSPGVEGRAFSQSADSDPTSLKPDALSVAFAAPALSPTLSTLCTPDGAPVGKQARAGALPLVASVTNAPSASQQIVSTAISGSVRPSGADPVAIAVSIPVGPQAGIVPSDRPDIPLPNMLEAPRETRMAMTGAIHTGTPTAAAGQPDVQRRACLVAVPGIASPSAGQMDRPAVTSAAPAHDPGAEEANRADAPVAVARPAKPAECAPLRAVGAAASAADEPLAPGEPIDGHAALVVAVAPESARVALENVRDVRTRETSVLTPVQSACLAPMANRDVPPRLASVGRPPTATPAAPEESAALSVGRLGSVAADYDMRTHAFAVPPLDAPPVAASPTAETHLAPVSGAAQPRLQGGTPGAEVAVRLGRGTQTTASTVLALARHSGDWNCSPTAMPFLSHQLRERTGMALMASDCVVSLDDPGLARLPFVYMTGNTGFRFKDAEVANLRAYLAGGGFLWADDSSDFSDEAFDPAFRREIARVLPDAKIERLSADFPAFHTGYDLTHGYRGYTVPPGDKYRLDYLEGVRVGDRMAVVYTRNDYGDGLNINPHTAPLMPSLTDLSPAQMQEGATRMGINLVLYFLSRGGHVETAFADSTARALRAGKDVSAPAVPEGAARDFAALRDAAGWFVESWGGKGELRADGDGLVVAFDHGSTDKTGFGRVCDPAVPLERRDVLVLDVDSRLRCGARVALGMSAGSRYFESQPFYVRPGRNTVFFRCDAATFKTEATGWEYRDTLPAPATVEKLNLLVYAPAAGEMRLAAPRIVRAN